MTVSMEMRRRAEAYWQVLSPQCEKLRALNQLSVGEVGELIDKMFDVFDELHKAGFKEMRMLHFFHLMGRAIDGYVQQVCEA